MRTIRTLSAAVAALALLAAACSGAPEEVGSVGDTTFTVDDITALYEDGFFDGDAIPINEQRRTDLFRLLAIEALGQAAEADFGVTPSAEQVQAAMDDARAQIDAAGATIGDFLGVPGASEEMLRLNSEFGSLRREVILELIDDEAFLTQLYDDGRGVTNVCVRHILTEDVETLDTAVERLEAGEDFAAVADDLSTDTGTPGGDLGCALASRYVTEFAEASIDAEIGEIVHPVETQFGFHLLIVDERTKPTFEELLADPGTFVPESEANFLWNDWFNAALRDADVEVADRFGTWTPVGIEPPQE